MHVRNLAAALALFPLIGLSACSDEPPAEDAPLADTLATRPADTLGATAAQPITVRLQDASGQDVGTATLNPAARGVEVAVQVSGLAPGEHGFHIHETGRCEPPGFESAGSHFNPTSRQHGLENPQGSHAGDLPNLTVSEDGTAQTTVVASDVSLGSGEPGSLVDGDGSALVIHAGADDQRTDPSGDSGARVACGVIERR